MNQKNTIIRVGDDVLTQKRGRCTVSLIEYVPSNAHSIFVEAVHVSDCFSERWIFTFTNGHFAYGNQVACMMLATEIVPELR